MAAVVTEIVRSRRSRHLRHCMELNQAPSHVDLGPIVPGPWLACFKIYRISNIQPWRTVKKFPLPAEAVDVATLHLSGMHVLRILHCPQFNTVTYTRTAVHSYGNSAHP